MSGETSVLAMEAEELRKKVPALDAQIEQLKKERDALQASNFVLVKRATEREQERDQLEAKCASAREHIEKLLSVCPHEFEGSPRTIAAFNARQFLEKWKETQLIERAKK